MTSPIISEMDHAMLAVFDHRVAIAAWERIGFKVRPVRQLVPMGGGSAGGDGGSAAILLHPYAPGAANFIEIARADPRTALPALQQLLCQREGVAMLVHATPAPADALQHFAALGLTSQLLHMTLPPFGPGEPVEVDIVLPAPGQSRLMFNAMRMSSTADFERDEWRDHANGARSWCGITYVEAADELAGSIDLMRRLYGREPVDDGTGGVQFQPGRVVLTLCSAEALQRRVGFDVVAGVAARPVGALLSFEVAELTAVRHLLRQRSVPHTESQQSIYVPGSELRGVAVEFRACAD